MVAPKNFQRVHRGQSISESTQRTKYFREYTEDKIFQRVHRGQNISESAQRTKYFSEYTEDKIFQRVHRGQNISGSTQRVHKDKAKIEEEKTTEKRQGRRVISIDNTI